MGGLFGGGGDIKQELMMPEWQQQTGQQLASWVQQYLPSYKPGVGYQGQFSAPMGAYEQQGLGQFGKFMNAPNTGDMFGAARSHLMDTMGGKYASVEKSPYFQAFKTQSMSNLSDLIDQTRARRGARGNFFHSAGLEEEGELAQKTGMNLDAIMGQMQQQERQNMLGAVPQLAQLDEYSQFSAPLKKIGASQSMGAYQRLLDQADLERRYGEFGRQRSELSQVPGYAQGLYQTQPDYGVKNWEGPSTFEQIMGLGSAMMPMLSGLATPGGMLGKGGSMPFLSW